VLKQVKNLAGSWDLAEGSEFEYWLLRNTRKTGHGRAATIARVSSLYGGADTRPFALLRRAKTVWWR
jgi:hypothetical protein